MNRLFAAAVISGLSFAGCVCVPSQVSCDYRGAGKAGCVDIYENKQGQFASTLKTFCEVEDGVFTTPGLCDRTGALGGCLCNGCERGRSVTWIYPPGPDGGFTTKAQLQAECMKQGRPFVETSFAP